jgi:hypothetical protein
MPLSIREQILVSFGTRLGDIEFGNQYNSNMGKEVFRSFLPPIDSSLAPCVGYHIEMEENTALYAKKEVRVLPVRVQGVAEFGSVAPPVMGERLYADINECVLGDQYTLSFDSGGTAEIVSGDTIVGETSGAEGLVISVSLDSGSWAGGNAAGTLTLRRVKGLFENNEDLEVSAVTGTATVDGTLSGSGPVDLLTGGMADAVTFFSGNLIMPDADGKTVGANLVFYVRYKQIAGNPYSQTN